MLALLAANVVLEVPPAFQLPLQDHSQLEVLGQAVERVDWWESVSVQLKSAAKMWVHLLMHMSTHWCPGGGSPEHDLVSNASCCVGAA